MNRFKTSLFPLALACSLSLLPPPMVSTADAQERFGDATDVVVVEIPVQVLRDGEPVRGLTAEDFEVREGRRQQPIVGFEVIDLTLEGGTAEAQEEVRPVPIAGRRHFLMLFDLSFSDGSAIKRAREAARELVLDGLHPTDVVAVGTYSSAGGANLVLGFTSDRQQIEYALQTLGLVAPAQQVRDPLGLVVADLESFRSTRGAASSGPAAVNAGLDPAAEVLDNLSQQERATRRDVARNEIMALSSSLTDLARIMASVQGRKHVVYLSEGFDSDVLLGLGAGDASSQQRSAELSNAAAEGRVWELGDDARFGSAGTQSVLDQMLEEFRKADCTIQAVDIGGLRTDADVRGPRRSTEDGLFLMANETGGEFFRNYNNLTEAMGEVLERTSVTYLLAIQPRDLEMDGSYHRLKVKLEGNVKGQLVHRPGYYAPRPLADQSPAERQLSTAGLILGGMDGGRVDTAVIAAPFDFDRARAYVPVLIEVDGESLLAGHSGSTVPLEIYSYAVAGDGGVRDFFSQALALDLDKVGGALRQSGFKFWGHFDLPVGSYTIRTLVRNGASGASALRVAPLRVPEFGSEASLLPPFFPEQPRKWLLGREAQKEGEEQPPYPFILNGEAFIPAARPVLRKGEAAQLCLLGYGLPEGEVRVAARVVAADGATVEGGRVAISERAAYGSAQQFVGTFDPGGIDAGSYELVVTVSDAEGGESQSSSLPIVVQG